MGARIEDDKKKRKRWDIGKNSFYETQDAHPALKKILHKFTKRLVKMDVGSLLWSNQGAPLLSVLESFIILSNISAIYRNQLNLFKFYYSYVKYLL